MGLAAPQLHPKPIFSHSKIIQNRPVHHQISKKPDCIAIDSATIYSSMSTSQDYHHQGIFTTFSNGFDRSAMAAHQEQQQQQQHHVAQQIRRDKLRVQASGFEPPPPLVALEEEETGGLPAVYETGGMLSEMFNFPPGASPVLPPAANDWYGNRQGMVGGFGEPKTQNDVVSSRDNSNIAAAAAAAHHHHHHHHSQISSINAADSAAAMQLFLMNPQPRSPSPPPPQPPPPAAAAATSSTLHMLLPNQVGAFGSGQFTWVPDHSSGHEGGNTAGEIGGVVEGQGLSLSLSSSLQHLEAAKAHEELRTIGDHSGLLFYNHSSTTTNSNNQGGASNYNKSLDSSHGIHQPQSLHHQGVHHLNNSFGSSSSIGVVNVLRNSKYVKPAQELLEEFCSVGRGQFKKNKYFGRSHSVNNPSLTTPNPAGGHGVGNSSSSASSKDPPPLSATDRIEHQRRKVKLLSMLDEVDRRYNHYCEQMQMVVNSFDVVMGYGAAVPYTALAQKAMSRHFRCLKDAIGAQLKHSCEMLGDKEGGGSGGGLTKGETPRLRMLEQSLRQQRAFHQMGMMEQEAWRPQRGLPERSVNILRAWLFEHFLHPYPSDADKHLLARQTGLSRNQGPAVETHGGRNVPARGQRRRGNGGEGGDPKRTNSNAKRTSVNPDHHHHRDNHRQKIRNQCARKRPNAHRNQ
ncbi:BEL1-like homeodomain protein 2 isoform X2 [Malania oleifera]|uniref:BEL1-like homeodomain protein 2 isoform X2 n=1 Tax=Malania oleifera TaxID=397392 RepID=UPI0025ADA3B3|nr:BEL1-like homeodomain protein 2 isoform X2 [Malania oleifera]